MCRCQSRLMVYVTVTTKLRRNGAVGGGVQLEVGQHQLADRDGPDADLTQR